MSGLTTREREGYRWIPREQAMTTEGHPITRAELREELQHYATAADLAELRGELKALRGWLVGAVGAITLVVTLAVSIAAIVVRVTL